MNKEVEQIKANANTYLCPCGSGRPIVDCCVSRRENSIPKPPKTGYAHPKCYAGNLLDCSRKVSAEHFLSRSIQDLIAENRKTVIITGPSWLKYGEEKTVPITSLAPNILCSRHNEVLSSLDALALKFLRYMFSFENQSKFLMVNGGEIERWMLKLLCGHLSSGWAGTLPITNLPITWLNIIFGNQSIPDGSGMYLLRGQDITARRHQVGAWLLESDAHGQINGMLFIFGGFQFMFFMGKPNHALVENIVRSGWELVYRPECLVIVVDSVQREVHFGPPPRNGFVVFKVDKTKPI